MLKHRSGSQKKKDSALEVNFFCHFPSNNWSCPFFTVDPTLSTEKCREFIFNTLIYTNADLYINIYNYKYIYNYIYIHIYINFKSYVLRRCSSRINSIDTIALKHRLYWERKEERESERKSERKRYWENAKYGVDEKGFIPYIHCIRANLKNKRNPECLQKLEMWMY